MAQPSPAETIKTRILIISDTHSAPLVDGHDGQQQHDRPFRQPLPAADVLLHCGDLTMAGHLHEYESTLDMLGTIDASLKLVIAGNHDISLDEAFYAGPSKGPSRRSNGERMHMKHYDPQLPSQARALWVGEEAKAKGVTYLDEGIHDFTLRNGAKLTVYASPYQPEFCNWAFPYERHEDRFNPPHLSDPAALNIAVNPVPDDAAGKIHVMMTHGPPYQRLDRTSHGLQVGCAHLLRAAARARPRLHAWGHIHEDWGVERVEWAADGKDVGQVEKMEFDEAATAEKRAAFVDVSAEGKAPLRVGEETLMVNASIMTLQYKPHNAPVLVDLDLPKADC